MVKKDKRVRIELTFDAVRDAEMLNFIDTYGKTRAGFIKNALIFYKKHFENMQSTDLQNITKSHKESFNENVEQENDKNIKKIPKLGKSFSSHDFNIGD